MTHICISKLSIVGSDNGLSPGRRQAIIWTNGGILFIGALGTKFSETLIAIRTFPFKKTHWKMSFILSRSHCVKIAQREYNKSICWITFKEPSLHDCRTFFAYTCRGNVVKILVSDYTERCHFDNFRCMKWRKYDDVIKWKHSPRYCSLCGEFTGDRWIPLT